MEIPEVYKRIIELLPELIAGTGYNIVVHGSMRRDLDLLAVPWMENCLEPKDLVKAIQNRLASHDIFGYESLDQPVIQKPHGRLAYRLWLGGAPYIDLSIMPKKPSTIIQYFEDCRLCHEPVVPEYADYHQCKPGAG